MRAPGPGNYNTLDIDTKKKMPSYKFGTGERVDLAKKSLYKDVGPGLYNSKEYFGTEVSGGTMGAKIDSGLVPKDSRNKPGPGTYDLDKTFSGTQMASYSIGKG
jgi:hypothetical protein